MQLIVLTITLLGLGFLGITIKLWLKKDGEFAGTCASQNPRTQEKGKPCSLCGKAPREFENCNTPQAESNL